MTDKEAATISKAVAHPLRIALLRLLREAAPTSAVQFSRKLSQPLGQFAYHLGALRDLGAIEVAEGVQRRGAIEHRYRPADSPQWRAVAEMLDVFERR